MDELRECPFCGNDDPDVTGEMSAAGSYTWITCLDCKTEGPRAETEAEARRLWNTRPAPASAEEEARTIIRRHFGPCPPDLNAVQDDIAAALAAREGRGMDRAIAALDAKADEMTERPNDYATGAIDHVKACAEIVAALREEGK